MRVFIGVVDISMKVLRITTRPMVSLIVLIDFNEAISPRSLEIFGEV